MNHKGFTKNAQKRYRVLSRAFKNHTITSLIMLMAMANCTSIHNKQPCIGLALGKPCIELYINVKWTDIYDIG